MSIRSEWVGDGLSLTDQSGIDLQSFAFQSSEDVLQVEPRLKTLAELVRLARPEPELLAEVGALAALLVGPKRLARQCTPVNAQSHAVTPALFGPTTLRRYLVALQELASADQ